MTIALLNNFYQIDIISFKRNVLKGGFYYDTRNYRLYFLYSFFSIHSIFATGTSYTNDYGRTEFHKNCNCCCRKKNTWYKLFQNMLAMA